MIILNTCDVCAMRFESSASNDSEYFKGPVRKYFVFCRY